MVKLLNLQRMTNKSFLCLLPLFALIVSCAINPAFNEANIDKLRVGMSSTEVREIFGSPNEVRVSTCGASTAGGTWTCETWKYNTYSSYKTNEFVFAVERGTKLLNNWDVRR